VEQRGTREQALGRLLDTAEDASPLQAVEAVTHDLAESLGATAVSFLIADLSGRALVRLTDVGDNPSEPESDRRDADDSAEEMPFDGGPAEEALRSQSVQVLAPDEEGRRRDTWTVLAPVTERGEALGLLEMSLPAEPDRTVLAEIVRTAHVLGFVVIANRRHTDLFEWGQRSTPYSLPAEIQRRLLPAAYTCEAGSFTLSAWLEPAANVGGDTFDYSLARDVLHLSITDAMGHGVSSALTATLCIGSLRNSRRQGHTLLEQVGTANEALLEHATDIGLDGFVTGLVGRLDLASGSLALVNAGHVAPYLAREGKVAAVELPIGLPLGLFGDSTYSTTEVMLEPGDRLVFVTDGMLERSAAALDLIAEIQETRSLHPRETTRCLADKVLEVTGPVLADDATMLVLDWQGGHGSPGGERSTVGGADSSGSGPIRSDR